VTVNIGRTTTLPVELTQGRACGERQCRRSESLVDTVRTTTQDNYGPEYLQEVQIGSNGRSYSP
jgi:hypothetical protein